MSEIFIKKDNLFKRTGHGIIFLVEIGKIRLPGSNK